MSSALQDPPRVALQCMEVWGGNQSADTGVNAPGLDAWLHSRTYSGHGSGGDMYYISSCASGNITRMAIADVAGHGDAAGALAAELRRLMRRSINTPDQTRIARGLNRSFAALAGDGRFATALLATYYAPTRELIVCNAGHPRPLWYRAAAGDWVILDESHALDAPGSGASRGPRNLPLGVIQPTSYTQFRVALAPGDIVLAYTDALIEAAPTGGRQLGEAGLLELARAASHADVRTLAEAILRGVSEHTGQSAAADDATLLAVRHTADEPPRLSIGERLRVTSRLLGLTR